jgi:hypothetical protein
MDDFEEKIKERMHDDREFRGLGWRISASILSVTTWLAGGVAWLFFLAGNYSIWENIALFLVSLVVLVGLNASWWIGYGMRFMPHGNETGSRRRSALSALAGVTWVLAVAFYLYQYAGEFTLYQNLGLLFVSLLILGGVNAAIHIGNRRMKCA